MPCFIICLQKNKDRIFLSGKKEIFRLLRRNLLYQRRNRHNIRTHNLADDKSKEYHNGMDPILFNLKLYKFILYFESRNEITTDKDVVEEQYFFEEL